MLRGAVYTGEVKSPTSLESASWRARLWPSHSWLMLILGAQAWVIPWLLVCLSAVAVWNPVASLPTLRGTTWGSALGIGNLIFSLGLGATWHEAKLSFTLCPWGLTLLIWVLPVSSLRRVKVASPWGLAWGLLGFALPAATGLGVAAWSFPALSWIPAAMLQLVFLVGFFLWEWARNPHWTKPSWWPGDFRLPDWVRFARRALQVVIWVGAALSLVLLLWAMFQGWTEMQRLWKALNPGVIGSIAVVFAALAYLPTALAWAMSWLVGPGFTAGEGTIYSPGSVQGGQLPPLPFFAWFPSVEVGWWPLAVPVAVALLVGILQGRRHSLRFPDTALAMAVFLVAYLVLGYILVWATGGSLGTQRLAYLGPTQAVVYAGVLAWGVPFAAGVLLAHPWAWQFASRFAARVSGKNFSELPTVRIEL